MAGEIQIQSSLTGTWSGGQVATKTITGVVNKQSTLTAKHQTTQRLADVGTEESLSLGDIPLDSQHIVRLRNENATAIITVKAHKDGSNSAVCGVMLPGETWGPCRLGAQTTGYPCIKIASSVANADVEVVAVAAGNPTL